MEHGTKESQVVQEIRLTREMIDAGAEIIEDLRDILASRELAIRVYRAMASVASGVPDASRSPRET